ncbi:BCCT family transporter [Streptomyces glaucosporus]|uniref:BCCT family transporter n=1 Tax=Streptomyces glaucosporus TaxID=284044 RepID=UPI0031DDFC98
MTAQQATGKQGERQKRAPKTGGGGRITPGVFWPSAAVIAAFVVFAVVGQDRAAETVGEVHTAIVGDLGWYYMALVSLFVIFALWVGIGRYGDIRLGKDGEEAEFGLGSWLAMLFAAGMGIGLVYWGVAEPLNFFSSPRPGVGEGEAERAEFAMVQTFLHWGIHPWAIYVVVGLAVAYAVHRKGRPVSIRWTLEPLLGDRIRGRWGDVIDTVAIVGTVFGVATSLGLGVLQISSGLDYLGWADSPGKAVQVVLIIAITAIATVSVVTGVARGIRWLSNINMVLAAVVALFVLVAGPTLFILSGLVQDVGVYLQDLLRMSFDTGASQGEEGTGWVSGWTVFYWGWWISWAPFVGIFIARISRGRTVREFITGVLLVPTALTFFWFAVFGGSALHGQMFGNDEGLIGEDGAVSTDNALFQLLDTLPGGAFMAGVTILLIVLFFVTSSDSGSYVVAALASGGAPEPPRWTRVFWSASAGLVAIALLLASGSGTASLDTLKTTAIIIALPFSVVMIGMCAATLVQFRRERRAYLEARRLAARERIVEEAVAAMEADLENRALLGPPASPDRT